MGGLRLAVEWRARLPVERAFFFILLVSRHVQRGWRV